jgi:formylglycine-generating enzyme required for sulfatase activity
MSDLLKKFLLDDLKRLSPNGRFVGLAAFGKHPGWDDHVEDLGLETESLNVAKIVFYVNGIGGQIDSGAWEKLDQAQQLPGFKHLFLWQRSGQILLGRLWSSSDGKGRKRYPMVVCLHFAGVTLRWALTQGLPALAELQEQIQNTNSAEEVRSVLNRKRAALREAAASTDGRGEYAPVSPEALNKILHPSGDSNSQGFVRVLYQMQSQFRSFAPGGRSRAAATRAQQIRVPSAGENPEQSLLFWTRFFMTQVDASVPLLICLPLDEHWVDVTAGEPESHEFFALRASPKAVPLVSEVPYTLDEAFQSQARAFLDGFQRGDTAPATFDTELVSSAKASGGAKGGWLKWLGVGVVAILGAIAVIVFMKGGPQPATTQASAGKPNTTNASIRTEVSATPPPTVAQKSQSTPSPKQEPVAATKQSEPPKPAPAASTATNEIVPPKPKEISAAPLVVTQAQKEAIPEKQPTPQPTPVTVATLPDSDPKISLASNIPPQTVPAAEPPPQAPLVAAAAPVASPTATPAPPPELVAGSQITNSIGMVLVLLPSKTWVGKYEVTRGEYGRIMESTTSATQNERLPADQVSWEDANEFCRRLTQKDAAQLAGKVYSLPTEKQWQEIRAGQKFEELPEGGLARRFLRIAPVGESSPANKLGLYDVLGNVWEWCLDGGSGNAKLQKGGTFNNTNYDRLLPTDKAPSNCGFRCVLISK